MKDYTPSDLCRQMMSFLDCPCQAFGPMRDDGPLTDAWRAARIQGEREGFTPAIVTADEILWECLTMAVDPAKDRTFDLAQVRAYRQEILNSPLPPAEEYFQYRLDRMKREAAEDGVDLFQEAMGQGGPGETIAAFSGYWDFASPQRTKEAILAKIPVSNPWQIFAWLPMGGWNDCPGELEMTAAARDWFRRFGAVPAVISHDTLEFALDFPVPADRSMDLALEHFAFCPDRVFQSGEESLAALAAGLERSTVWYFWWD